jgi:hypothetical protein
MIELVKRRAFVLVGGVFLVYGVSAMGDESATARSTEALKLPSIRADYLRLRASDESLERVSDPFVVGSAEPIVIPPESLAEPPVFMLFGAPLPGTLEPASVLPQPMKPVVVEAYKPKALFAWPDGFLLTLEGTMSAGGSHSARINGTLLMVGQALAIAGEELVLESVDGISAVLRWRGHPIRLDLLKRASVEAGGMPIDS